MNMASLEDHQSSTWLNGGTTFGRCCRVCLRSALAVVRQRTTNSNMSQFPAFVFSFCIVCSHLRAKTVTESVENSEYCDFWVLAFRSGKLLSLSHLSYAIYFYMIHLCVCVENAELPLEPLGDPWSGKGKHQSGQLINRNSEAELLNS
jgi:hypothetical protein